MNESYHKNEIQKIICQFIYFACAKDLFYLEGDEGYLKDEKYNDETIYMCGDNLCKKYYDDNSLEYRKEITKFLEICKNKENEDRKWLDIIDKTCKSQFNENFISLILKRTNTVINSMKRPSSFKELDIKTLINILYDRDLRKEQINIEMLVELMCSDNTIHTIYSKMKKTIKYLDKKQNPQITYAVIIGLIIAIEKSSKFPQTLTEAYNVFYNDDNWILENQFDERTLQMLCLFVLTDCFSKYPMKINKQEKFEFAFCLFLLIIKSISKKTLESAELFWQNDIIAIFMICCINDNAANRSISANKIYDSMKNNTPFDLDKKSIKNEVIEKLTLGNDLDFIIFIFMIAYKIKDKEILDLIENKDEIKALAFDKSLKVMDLINKISDSKLQKLLQSIDDYFIYKANENADVLIYILKKTHNELEISYNEELTLAIYGMINSNTKYKDIYNEVKSKINLGNVKEIEKKRIYALISHGEYLLKDDDISNYSPSVNQYCSALERLLNEIIYKPYFSEIQDICIVKNNNYNFTKDKNVQEKYFGNNIPHAMWIRDKKLSLMSLGELGNLMKNILNDNDKLDIFKKATKEIFHNNIDIKMFFTYICDGVKKIKPDRDEASHGELMNRDKA